MLDHAAIQTLFAVNEVELVYRNRAKTDNRIKVTSAHTAYDVFLSAWDMNKIDLLEEFLILLLDRNNQCLGLSRISSGGISSCVVDPKIVFATALKARASGLILAHNHPSGNLIPSRADEALTRKLIEGGHLLEIGIMDHLIITPTQYYSFANEGLIP
jgi:DNA repair protein RadC